MSLPSSHSSTTVGHLSADVEQPSHEHFDSYPSSRTTRLAAFLGTAIQPSYPTDRKTFRPPRNKRASTRLLARSVEPGRTQEWLAIGRTSGTCQSDRKSTRLNS